MNANVKSKYLYSIAHSSLYLHRVNLGHINKHEVWLANRWKQIEAGWATSWDYPERITEGQAHEQFPQAFK